MSGELTYTQLYIEYLRTHTITNKFFDITFERLHTTSGSIVFKRKSNGQIIKCKFIIRQHARDAGIDITLVLLGHRFRYIYDGLVKTSHFFTSETDLFQERISDLLDIV